MAAVCTYFDEYYKRWHQDIYRMCFILSRSAVDAQQLSFDVFLRLGAARNAAIGQDEAKALLFSSAVRLCDDYYLRKMRRRPKRASYAQANLPFPITDALWQLMGLPFKARAALCLAHAGFSDAQAARMCRLHGGVAALPGKQREQYMEAIASVCLPQDDAQALCDRVYDRFAERSVAFENRLHSMKSAMDHAAPYLALAVLALFLFAAWFSMQMAV